VAYTDKGTGNGGHDLAANAVNVMLGPRYRRDRRGPARSSPRTSPPRSAPPSTRVPESLGVQARAFAAEPEKDWGRDTLRAIEFAFYMLNEKYGAAAATAHRTIVPSNTIVIASSVSNGAGAAIARPSRTRRAHRRRRRGRAAVELNAPRASPSAAATTRCRRSRGRSTTTSPSQPLPAVRVARAAARPTPRASSASPRPTRPAANRCEALAAADW
jgi:hydroxybutyrate-dimer hydrolase